MLFEMVSDGFNLLNLGTFKLINVRSTSNGVRHSNGVAMNGAAIEIQKRCSH